ncbi:MAG: DsbC family protein [Pseudomonadota bacterium]
MLKKILCLALAVGVSCLALADEASIKKSVKQSVESKLGAKVSNVVKSPYFGLYEVYADGQIIYTDDKVSALLVGALIDGKTLRNVTEERMQKLSAIKFSDLPIDLAIKQVRGDGKRVFASFEDPNCGYCKKLAKEVAKLDNVTIYIFLYPILSPDSLDKSKQIWCAADRSRAWNEWMVEGKMPSGKGDCDTSAVLKSLEVGRKLSITGTPTLFFADGERIPGAVPIARIEQKLGQNR